MKSNVVPLLTGAAVVAVVWLASAYLLLPALGGPKGVDLTFVGANKGCVTADPDPVTIFKKGVLKPKRVKWTQKTDGYYWEIKFKPYGGNGTNYLGAVPPIQCGKKHTTSGRPAKDFPGELRWYYSVTVFECADGKKGGEVCPYDPMVRILD